MKNRLFIFLLTIFITLLSGFFQRLKAQNYWNEYPISAVTQNNGSQQRLVLSTYDSTLQTTVTAYTQWITGYYFFSTANGKLTFITYLNPGQQTSRYGFGIYDFVLHQFNIKELDHPLTGTITLNVVSSPYWVVSAFEDEYNPGDFYLTETYHRYSMVFHQWNSINVGYNETTWFPQIFNIWAPGDTEWLHYIEDTDEGDFYHYNPVSGFAGFYSGCAGWYNEMEEEHFAVDGNCSDDYSYVSLDPEAGWQGTPLYQTIGDLRNGIFTASNQWPPHFPKYIFTYDIGIHQMIYDSTTNLTATDYVIKDRVASYSVSSNGTSPMIYFLVHDPLQHAWIKDSAVTTGLVNPTIINGTVHWTDANGSHFRGYDVTTGWGNYTTPLFMYFHLSDFTNSHGVPLVHMRNYSIGKEQFYFDMGDGVVSSVRNNLWHLYDQPGPYNICMYEASGVQSVCQNFNYCGLGGISSINLDTICAGDQIELSLTGHQGIIQWQSRTNSLVWTDITSPGFDSSVIYMNPLITTHYRAKVTDGSCNSVYSNPQTIVVSAAIAGTLASSPTAGCLNREVHLKLDGFTGTLSWQKDTGSGYVTIPNSSNPVLIDLLTGNTFYRCIVSPAMTGCLSDTSQEVQIIAGNPGSVLPLTGMNICGDDTITLNASGSGIFQWYEENTPGSAIVSTGATFNAFVSNTTTFFVSALSGFVETAGLTDTISGNSKGTFIYNRGLRVVSSDAGYLESLVVYPNATGNLTVKLLHPDNTTIATIQHYVPVTGVPFTIPLGFNLDANQIYHLKFYANFAFIATSGGFTYPISNPGSSLEVLGHLNNNTFSTDSSFYTGYNIVFSKGCKSLREPVTVQHTPEIVGTLTALGPTTFCQGQSVVLAAAPTGSGNAYKWYRGDSLISNATGSNYTAAVSGLYRAQIYNAVCSDTTSSIRVRIPCISTFDPEEKSITDEFAESNFNVFYQSTHQQLVLKCEALANSISKVAVYDLNGRLIIQQNWTIIEGSNSISLDVNYLNAGSYIVKWINSERTVVTKWVKHQ